MTNRIISHLEKNANDYLFSLIGNRIFKKSNLYIRL